MIFLFRTKSNGMRGLSVNRLLGIAAFLPMFCAAHASTPAVYSGAPDHMRLGSYVEILEDKDGSLSFKDVYSSEKFVASKEENPNLGTSASTFWIRFRIKNTSSAPRLMMELASPLLSKVELFGISQDGKVDGQIGGEIYPFSYRKYRSNNHLFDIHIRPGEEKLYFMKIKSGAQIQLPL